MAGPEGMGELMSVTATPRLAKTGLPPVSDETATVIENLVDTAFWQLMLGDDLEACSRDVDLLCATLRLRMAQIRVSAGEAEL